VSRKPRLVQSNPPRREQEIDVRSRDFNDEESRLTLTAKARSIAWSLGYDAYRELRNGTAR
jgi:hypothetical protein